MSVKLVHNVETGEITKVELDAAEIAQLKKDIAASAEELKAQNVKVAQKTALLERLNITEDEAKLLLG
jgi:hypothetical protein